MKLFELFDKPAEYKTFKFFDLMNDNRRFMFYNNKMILGARDGQVGGQFGSHAQEHAYAEPVEHFDKWYVRGWVGMGRNYPQGVIHFAPSWGPGSLQQPDIYNDVMDSLEYFKRVGANDKTLVRGLYGFAGEGELYKEETPLGDIL